MFLSTEDFSILAPYLDKIFHNYHYYGPQKIKFEEWKRIKELYISSKEKKDALTKFFCDIDNWLEQKKDSSDFFWILGV